MYINSFRYRSERLLTSSPRRTLARTRATRQPDQLQNPEWPGVVENDPAQAFASRVAMLDRVSANRTLVLAYHEQFPGLGYVSRWGPFYDWNPVPLDTLQV